jgi:hypothetical protein
MKLYVAIDESYETECLAIYQQKENVERGKCK